MLGDACSWLLGVQVLHHAKVTTQACVLTRLLEDTELIIKARAKGVILLERTVLH